MYDDGVSKTAEGRSKTTEEIEKRAQGRVWSGLQARDLGLVDSINGFDAALAIARQKAGFAPDQDVRIVKLPRAGSFDFLPFFAAPIAGAMTSPEPLESFIAD